MRHAFGTTLLLLTLIPVLAGCIQGPKPSSPDVDAIAPDVPFAPQTPLPDFARIDAAEVYGQRPDGAAFELAGVPFVLYATWPTPSTLKLAFVPDQAPEPPVVGSGVSVVRRDETVVLSTSDAHLVVGKEPFGLRLYRADGELLFDTGSLGFSWTPSRTVKSGLNFPYSTSVYDFDFKVDPADVFYGFGERFDMGAHRNKHLESWICDCLQVGDYIRKGDSYYVVPFFWTPRGFGIYIDSTGDIRYNITLAPRSDEFDLQIPKPGPLDLYVFVGPPAAIMSDYTDITGRPRLPPRWSFEQWIDGAYKEGDDGQTGAQAMRDYIARFETHRIPFRTVTVEDWTAFAWFGARWQFNPAGYPDPAGMVKEFHDKGLKVVVWETPGVSPASTKWAEGDRGGYFVKDRLGQSYVITPANSGQTSVAWMQGVSVVDFTNPAAVAWWKEQHRGLMQLGIDGYKADAGEESLPDMYFHNGETGVTMHNRNAMHYNLALADQLFDERGEGAIIGRSGTVGSQATSGMWAGDQYMDSEWTTMRAWLYGGVSSSASGLYWYSFDVCGLSGTCDKETFLRSSQIAFFMPWWKAHVTYDHPRNPWEYDAATLASHKRYADLRQSLLDYSFHYAQVANTTGVPLVRTLAMEFPSDPTTWPIDDEFLHGPDLLVAPVIDKGATSRDVYLPQGSWLDLHDGSTIDGPVLLSSYAAPAEKLPLFWRLDTPDGNQAPPILPAI